MVQAMTLGSSGPLTRLNKLSRHISEAELEDHPCATVGVDFRSWQNRLRSELQPFAPNLLVFCLRIEKKVYSCSPNWNLDIQTDLQEVALDL